LRAKATNPTDDVTAEVGYHYDVELEELLGLQIGNDAIGAVGARRLLNAKTISSPAFIPMEEEHDDDEAPLLVNHDLPNLRAVLDEADVVIEVLDARDPLAFRSSHLEELAARKQVLLVLNKIGQSLKPFFTLTISQGLNSLDTCPRESISAWAAHLRTQYPTALFRSATAYLPLSPASSAQAGKGKGKTKAITDDALGVDSILGCLGEWAKSKTGDEPLTVAVLGVTNVCLKKPTSIKVTDRKLLGWEEFRRQLPSKEICASCL